MVLEVTHLLAMQRVNFMYYTIYKITNLINGKTYIGKHQTKNLYDDYMGSGKLIVAAISKYGLKNFRKDILFVFDNKDDMDAKEEEIVTEDYVQSPDTYNLKTGGTGGWDHINNDESLRIAKNKHAKRKLDEALLKRYGVENAGQLLHCRTQSAERMKMLHAAGKIRIPKFTGKVHTEETKQKMSNSSKGQGLGKKNSQFGTCWITNGIESKKIKKNTAIPVGWYAGRKINKR